MSNYYIIEETTLRNLANAIRRVNGETHLYTPDEMIQAVTNIMDSVTFLLVDEYGAQYPAVFVENKTIFDATADDISLGKTAASDDGVIIGTGKMSDGEENNAFILIDENGNELAAVMTEEIVDLTAEPTDIRAGKTAVTDDGVVVGTLNA
jgi:hypothetical protein